MTPTFRSSQLVMCRHSCAVAATMLLARGLLSSSLEASWARRATSACPSADILAFLMPVTSRSSSSLATASSEDVCLAEPTASALEGSADSIWSATSRKR